jgi:hypothetical protein
MKVFCYILLLCYSFSSLIFCQRQENNSYVDLLDDSNLTGWYAKDGNIDVWKLEDSILSCTGKGGGWLTTKKEYSDFILRLEWRIPEEGNSGVGIRYPKEGNPAHDGMEIQVLDDDADKHKDLRPAQFTGGIYYQVPAKRGFTNPPGEWNSFEITCEGPQVKVVLNGTEIVEVNMDKYTEGQGDYLPLSKRPRSGHIGVQSHGTGVDYRNIQIRELNLK